MILRNLIKEKSHNINLILAISSGLLTATLYVGNLNYPTNAIVVTLVILSAVSILAITQIAKNINNSDKIKELKQIVTTLEKQIKEVLNK